MTNTPTRVLHVVGGMNRGGAEAMLMSLYRAIDRERIQFDFLEMIDGRTHYSDEIEAMGGRLLKCKWSQSLLGLRKTIKNITRIIENEGPFAAVHSHILFGSGTVLVAAARAGVPTRIAHSHNTSVQRSGMRQAIYEWLARVSMQRNATELVACTQQAGEFLFGGSDFSRRGLVVQNAVNTETFRPPLSGERRALRSRYGVPDERMLLVAVARLEPVKNHRFLLDVASQLRGSDADFEVAFVGDGSLRRELELQVENRSLKDSVRFWGVRTDIPEILRAADLLLIPSHFEGLPVALVEAQAAGLRCIVSTAVDAEADMGLGLVQFLPTLRASEWAEAVASSAIPTERPGQESISSALAARGYRVEESIELLMALYLSSGGGSLS